MTAETVAAALSPRTKAVLVVHLFGRPAPWRSSRRRSPTVSRCSRTLRARSGRVGKAARAGLGRLGCSSFHPRKIVTTGEGGAVTTIDPEIADAIPPLPPPRHRAARRLRDRAAGDLPPAGHPLRSGRRRRPGSGSCSPSASALRRPTRSGSARRSGSSADEGDRHGWQAYVVRTDGGTRRSRRLPRRDPGITYALHRLAAYADQGPSRCGRGVRACARAALPRPADRGSRGSPRP